MIELLTVVSATVVLAAMALPAINSSRNSYRLTTARDGLVAALELARSEAIKRGSTASVVINSSTSYVLTYTEGSAQRTNSYTLPVGVAFTLPSGTTSITVQYFASGKTSITNNAGAAVASISLSNPSGAKSIQISIAGNLAG